MAGKIPRVVRPLESFPTDGPFLSRLLALELLLISGNVHPNSGPTPSQSTTSFPCAICACGVGSRSMQCTRCNLWVHLRCSGLSYSTYRAMCSGYSSRGWLFPAYAGPSQPRGSPKFYMGRLNPSFSQVAASSPGSSAVWTLL